MSVVRKSLPICVLGWALALLCLGIAENIASAQSTNATAIPFASQLVEFAGRVEIAVANTNTWLPVTTNQWLYPGDRLRTGVDSRATIRLSDQSVVRINQSTLIELQSPNPPAQRRFGLKRGALYFLNREKPAAIEFETPLATGAIRGTEFLLTASEETPAVTLALFDGAVSLKSERETIDLTSGQQVELYPNQDAKRSAILPANNLIQWCFYYPGVVNPAELHLSAEEVRRLTNSLAGYTSGALPDALANLPPDVVLDSPATRIYVAALKLAVGQVDSAEQLVAGSADSELAIALREVIAATKGAGLQNPKPPSTSSGWLARSYYLQSRRELPAALAAAQQAVASAPEWGFAWARLAELQFGFGDRAAARKSLTRAIALTPRHAQAFALQGFLELDANQPGAALNSFERALALDRSLPTAWFGRGLAHEALGELQLGQQDLQTAAALEPQRSLYRSYLGKAWSQSHQDHLAEKDFAYAQQLDPADPTAWLYSALHQHQTGRINAALRDLEDSRALNDNRGVFRSRELLDQDRAARSADLAAIYNEAGLTEVSDRNAARAVQESYADFSGHLFLSRSLQAGEDPSRYDLRFETARQSELLVANLLAPPGGGNLSQLLSQQDHLQNFMTRPFGLSTVSSYGSGGDWMQSASAFGAAGRFSYAVDGQYNFSNGQRPNNWREDAFGSVTAKQQLNDSDSVYAQANYFHSRSGDVAQHYDPASAILGLKATEEQNPNLYAGWHHEWSPGSHTLLLLARLTDDFTLTNPQPSVLFLRQNTGGIYGAEQDFFHTLNQQSDFTLYSAELQQIWETPEHALILGGRYQRGEVETHAMMEQLLGATLNQSATPHLERINSYAQYRWTPINSLRLIAGLSYDDLTFPRNIDLPPLDAQTDSRSVLGPKLGFAWNPWAGGWWRGAWTRSLGGLYFDNSIRLEPAQVAGFTDAYRSLIPESAEGIVPGTRFDTWGLGFDQALAHGAYFGVNGEWLKSDGSRDVGAFSNSIVFILFPDAPTATRQTLDFEEHTVSAYVSQLLGENWSTGLRYRWSEAELTGRFPDLAGVGGVENLNQDQRSVLQQAQAFLLFNHHSGLFAGWTSSWYHQSNSGYTPARPGDEFWQHDVFIGYRFPHRRAELRVGILNLTDQDYRLNELNLYRELARQRTFTATLRMNF